MRSIQKRFKFLTDKQPNISDYINLVQAVKDQNFTKNMINRWFTKLISPDDYDRKDKKRLITHLAKLSNEPEDNSF